MFSIAIPTYNRYHKIEKTLNILKNINEVSEVIIVDDDSSNKNNLLEFEKKLDLFPKVKLFKNKKNLGPFHNKIKAVSYCNNNWVLLLDSDIYIKNDFFKKININKLNKNTLYHSQHQILKLKINELNNDNFNIIEFDNDVFHYYKKYKTYLLNTSNYLLNKTQYLKILNEYNDTHIFYNDAYCLTYIWLVNNMKLQVLPELTIICYPDSFNGFYIKFQKKNKIVTNIVNEYYDNKNKTWDFKEALKDF